MLYSLLGTCKVNKIKPNACLKDIATYTNSSRQQSAGTIAALLG